MAGLIDESAAHDAKRVVAVRVEAPESVDDTVVAYADGHKLFIQVKENIRTNEDAWTELWKDYRDQFGKASFQKGRDQLLLVAGTPHQDIEDLKAIADRAKSAGDVLEFHGRLTENQSKLLREIDRILFALNAVTPDPENGQHVDPPTPTAANPEEKPKRGRPKKRTYDASLSEQQYVLELFKHVDVRIEPMYVVERSIIYLFPESNRTQEELFKRFRDRAGESARLRGTFDRQQLLDELEQDGILLKNEISFDELKVIAEKSGAELKAYKNTFGRTVVHLERAVTRDIVEWVTTSKEHETIAVLLDSAGTGKTVVARDILAELESENIPVLTLKGDSLSGIESLDDLETRLGLGANIERALALLSQDGKAVLLVDQIDALSLSLARDLTALDVVLKLVARARMQRYVRVIIACREFDLRNDPKLSRLEVSREFKINPLTDEEVRLVLKEFDIEFGSLQPSVQELLRTPLHLDLFSRVADEAQKDGSMSRLLGLNSLQDLYAALWELVIVKPLPGAPPPATRERVLELITERMNANQEVSVPRSWLRAQGDAELDAAANWLASHGILIASRDRWTLLHQTLFDYCYAKSFVEQGKSLYETIAEGDQGLFVRSQLLQVLNYSRGVDEAAYLKDLSRLLSAANIRFHLRDHVMRWFGSISPTDNEWRVARDVLKGENGRVLRGYMLGNPAWFVYLKNDIIAVFNSGDDDEIDGWAIQSLNFVFERAQREVAEIVRPFLTGGPVWIRRLNNLFWQLHNWDPSAIELFEEVLRRSDETERREVYRLKSLAETSPADACRILRIILDREFAVVKKRDPSPITWAFRSDLEHLNGSGLDEVLKIVLEKEPQRFLDELTPWLEKILADANIPDDYEYFHSDPLSSGLDYGTFVVETQLLGALQQALVELGRTDPDSFLRSAGRFAGLPYQTPQRLLARAFTDLSPDYSTEANEFLIADRRRLTLGPSEVFDSRQLVKMITPHLNVEQTRQLEDAIRALATGKGKHLDEFRWRFMHQLYLLHSFAAAKLSIRGKKWLAELGRKYPKLEVSERVSLGEGGFVGSPIERDATEKMSDESWLSAFRRYSKGHQHKEFLKGGAEQLAGELSERVRRDPERFYNLALSTPLETEKCYLSALISGLAAAGSDYQLVAVIRRFNAIDDERLRQATASALRDRDQDVPQDILEALERHLYDPAGEDEEGWRKHSRNNRRFDTVNDSPFISLLNSRRGALFQAVMRVLDARGDAISRDRKWVHLIRLADEGSEALKAGVLEQLLYLYPERQDECVDLFEAILSASPDLLTTHFALEFIRYATPSYFERMLPFMEKALESEYEAVQNRAGVIASLAQMYKQIYQDASRMKVASALALKARRHEQPGVRVGAAKVYVSNLQDNGVRAICVKNLVAMLGTDEDKNVRSEISDLFTSWNSDEIGEIREVVERFVEAGVPLDEERDFGDFIFRVGLSDTEWALAMIRKFIDKNPVTGGYRDGEFFIRFAIRVYVDPILSRDTKGLALTLFDDLMLRFSGAANVVLRELDRS